MECKNSPPKQHRLKEKTKGIREVKRKVKRKGIREKSLEKEEELRSKVITKVRILLITKVRIILITKVRINVITVSISWYSLACVITL